ncbi:unnamed protein product, partial [Mesorhabditis belari]|uniref:Tyrosine-protein phosphatase domain-containing protein n=1 Tax=Mesorhabditis belari TaxID=2138241 RepID=A0AAF3EYS3_9BILA
MNRTRSRMSRFSRREIGTFEAMDRVTSKFGEYVIAQSPKHGQAAEFVKMIQQCDIALVVQLSPQKDTSFGWFEGRVGSKKKLRGRYLIETVSITEHATSSHYELQISTILPEEKSYERTVYAVYYHRWQEFSTENSRCVGQILRDIFTILQRSKANGHAPILVHGGGARNSASFVLLSMVCRQLRQNGASTLCACIDLVRKYKSVITKDFDQFCSVLHGILQFAVDDDIVQKNNKSYQQAFKLVHECTSLHPLPIVPITKSENTVVFL